MRYVVKNKGGQLFPRGGREASWVRLVEDAFRFRSFSGARLIASSYPAAVVYRAKRVRFGWFLLEAGELV